MHMIYICLPLKSCHIFSTTALSSSDDSFSQIVTKVTTPLDTHERLFLPLAASSALWASLISFSPLWANYLPQTHILTFILFLIMCWKGVYVHECRYPQIRRLDPAGGCESPSVGAGNPSWILLTAEPCLQSLSSTSYLTRDDNHVSGIYLLSR